MCVKEVSCACPKLLFDASLSVLLTQSSSANTLSSTILRNWKPPVFYSTSSSSSSLLIEILIVVARSSLSFVKKKSQWHLREGKKSTTRKRWINLILSRLSKLFRGNDEHVFSCAEIQIFHPVTTDERKSRCSLSLSSTTLVTTLAKLSIIWVSEILAMVEKCILPFGYRVLQQILIEPFFVLMKHSTLCGLW